MDEIDKRIQNRYNIFNSNSINSNKEEKEKCKINLRKKKIQNIMMRKRYYDEYSNISSHNNNLKLNKKRSNIIDISSFLSINLVSFKETKSSIN